MYTRILSVLLLAFITTATQLSAQTIADVNLNIKRSVGSVSTFDRDVFINIHTTHTENQLTLSQLQAMDELGINFGRSVGGTTYNMNRINENANQRGFFDLDHMDQVGNGGRNWYNTQTWRHPYEPTSSVVTAHINPTFPNGTRTDMGWAPANYQAVGQFFGYYMKHFFAANENENGEPTPKYLEVINEPFVHVNDLGTTNVELSKFHKVVADSVHLIAPKVKVGGFTAAWPEFERNNFSIWDESWKVFIDEAGESMDFYSLHLYDVPFVDRPDVQRKGANMEAILDMIEQYSLLKLGKTKPFVVSEYGGCCAGWDGPYYEERDWHFLKSVSAMTMQMMERPNLMAKAVPFITGISQWYFNGNGFPYPHNIFIPDGNGGQKYSHIIKYYELWKNVNGTRVDTYADDPDLLVDAFVDGNKAYVILTNLDHAIQQVDLGVFEDAGTPLVSVTTKHLHAINDIPQLDEFTETTAPASFALGAEGTVVIEYEYTDPILIDKNLLQTKYYADTYRENILSNASRTFNINGVQLTDNSGEATLRLGLGRAHGKSLKPVVSVNGTRLEVPSDWRGYDQLTREDFFGLLEIRVPYNLLRERNEVSVRFSDAGGVISTVTLDVKNFDSRPVRTSASQPLLSNASLRLFPNPTNQRINFEWQEAISSFEVTLFDLQGRAVRTQRIARGDEGMMINDLPSGIYTVRAAFPEGVVARKVVVGR